MYQIKWDVKLIYIIPDLLSKKCEHTQLGVNIEQSQQYHAMYVVQNEQRKLNCEKLTIKGIFVLQLIISMEIRDLILTTHPLSLPPSCGIYILLLW